MLNRIVYLAWIIHAGVALILALCGQPIAPIVAVTALGWIVPLWISDRLARRRRWRQNRW